jgi:tRNA-Thr(GGU) m(6)t(6)A37 methyltransferase TsaA
LNYPITPIGHILTPFSQKFAIPRQGLSLSPAKGTIVFTDDIDVKQASDGIEAFSHLWILFLFHENLAQGFKAKVRPPRLGGNKKVGVFASRSSFRPNGIGMSLVRNLGMKDKQLLVDGVDLLDKTPIIDIKPYLPYADAVSEAYAGYADDKPINTLAVKFSASALQQLDSFQEKYSDLSALIRDVLAQDPRPSYKSNKQDNKVYFIRLYNLDIKWLVEGNTALVTEIYPIALT